MSTPSGPTRAGRLLRTSAFGLSLAGAVAVGVALPATLASATTPVGAVALANTAAPAPSLSTPAPRPLPSLAGQGQSGAGGGLGGSTPRVAPPPPTAGLGQEPARPVQPHGGIDTGAGGTQPRARSGTDITVGLAAGGAGLGALAGFSRWRRRRAGVLG